MPADLIRLVRHGEVHNPAGVLYGRLPEFHLSELGHRMALAAAQSLAGHPLTRLVASPLLRTQESAAPWSALYGLPIDTDERLIEPSNQFEGLNLRRDLPRKPQHWPLLLNPWRPAWGEAFTSIQARMMAAIADAHSSVESGEVVLVSHQLPITVVARTVGGLRLAHNPSRRRCTLSSITTLSYDGERFVEVDYQEPAAALLANSIDLGAV